VDRREKQTEKNVCVSARPVLSLQSLKWKSPLIHSWRGGTLPSNRRKWYFPQIQAMSVKIRRKTAGKTAEEPGHTDTNSQPKKKEIPPMVLSTTSLTKSTLVASISFVIAN